MEVVDVFIFIRVPNTYLSEKSKNRLRDSTLYVSYNTGSRNLSFDLFDMTVSLLVSLHFLVVPLIPTPSMPQLLFWQQQGQMETTSWDGPRLTNSCMSSSILHRHLVLSAAACPHPTPNGTNSSPGALTRWSLPLQ